MAVDIVVSGLAGGDSCSTVTMVGFSIVAGSE